MVNNYFSLYIISVCIIIQFIYGCSRWLYNRLEAMELHSKKGNIMYMLYILACILWEAGSNNYRSFLDNLMGTIVVFLCVRWSMTITNTMCSFYYSYSTCTVCITTCQRYTNGLQTGNLIIIVCNSCKILSGVHEIHGYLRSCNYFFWPTTHPHPSGRWQFSYESIGY